MIAHNSTSHRHFLSISPDLRVVMMSANDNSLKRKGFRRKYFLYSSGAESTRIFIVPYSFFSVREDSQIISTKIFQL